MRTLLRAALPCVALAAVLAAAPSVRGDAPSPGADVASGPDLWTPRIAPASARLGDGRVAVFGGHTTGFHAVDTAEVLAADGSSWAFLHMNATRDNAAVTRLADGRVFLAGGAYDYGIAPGHAWTEIYDPATDTFTPSGALSQPRMTCAAATLASGNVLVMGGWYDTNACTYGDVWDAATGVCSPTEALATPRSWPLVVPCTDGSALVLSGAPPYGGAVIRSVERFDPATRAFSLHSTELLGAADPGWVPSLNGQYMLPLDEQRMADGRYLFHMYRDDGAAREWALFTVDPATRTLARLETTPALPTGWTFGPPMISTDGLRAWLLAVDATDGWSPHKVFGVEFATGRLVEPEGTFDPPALQSPFNAAHAVLAGDVIALAGGYLRPPSYNGNYAASGSLLVLSADPFPVVTIPAAPDGLAAVAQYVGEIELTWNDLSTGESGFIVERRTPDGTWGEIARTGAGATSFTDDTFAPGTAYEYRVCAWNAAGTSDFAAPAALTTPQGKLQRIARVNFGRVRLGEERTRRIVVRNRHRKTDLLVEVKGTDTPFAVEHTDPLLVRRRKTLRIEVRFAPAELDVVEGELVLYTSDPANAEVFVQLKGKGRPPRGVK
mgnify:CR=1 FL=1